MLREIRLYGELGQRFGRVHFMAVESVGEAIRAMMANFKDFESAMINHQPGFKVWCGSQRLNEVDEIHLPAGHKEVIRIAPVVAGAAKGGLFSILLGAALVAGAIFSGGATLAFSGLEGVQIASIVGSIGVNLILGGIAQLLAPTKDNSAGSQDTSNPSYVFNGAVNTTAQGHPVPVGYGRLIVGSAVISAGVYTEDMPLS